MKIKPTIKRLFNVFGVDIVKLNQSPQQTLLGIHSLPIQTVIDVGANTGQFARYISNLFPQAKLYCFEPLTKPFQQLEAWAQHQKNQIITLNLALGEEEGIKKMFLHIDHNPSSSLLATTEIAANLFPQTTRQEEVSVKLTTLDSAYHQFFPNLMDDILIKLDVQGYEEKVILGGKEIFSRAKACILEISLDKLYQEQAHFKNILIMLDNLKFDYAGNLSQIYAKDGHVIYFDAIFVKKIKNR
ncbi:MAG: FkbM family methyltransferase [Thioploca sp.]|nr:FkbM family methyltransferase [Thioploca sp.]